MIRIVFVATLVALVAAQAPLKPQVRLPNGNAVEIENLPYQASLQVVGSHVCGATIIHTRAVLTAARCTIGFSVSFASVRVGSSYLNAGGKVHQLRNIFRHPLYDRSTNDYDVAVIEVKRNFTISSTVQVVPLAVVQPSAGVLATISGYGAFESGNNGQLRELQIPTVSREECENQYGSSVITDRMTCAGNHVEVCKGDYGGALVYDGAVTGISSWGLACNEPNYAAVFTDVTESNIAEFIKNRAGI